jgi:glyoxylase I family protein
MKIEHTAYQVESPVEVARWYVEHLGLVIKRSQSVEPFGHFLADEADSSMLEFYRNPSVGVPDYWRIDPAQLHLAFSAANVTEVRERLIAAGATPVGDVGGNDLGDQFAMLRDPWGLPVQLVRRQRPMIE